MRFKKCKRLIALLSMLAMMLSLIPSTVVADGELNVPATAPRFSQAYTAMSGVALDADVEGMKNGTSYISYWKDTAYTFVVGIDVFSNFEEAYNTILDKELDPNIFVLTGEHGDLTITAPVTVYGYYYDINPNLWVGSATTCPALNSARQRDRESCVGNLHIAENVRGQVTVNGLVFQGNFVDATRPINAEITEISVKNCIVCHEAGVPVFGDWAFNVNTYNNQNGSESAADNKDSFTIKDCRVEHLETLRICSNMIAPTFTVDGLVTISGCTPFFGFPQWKRYTKDAVFTMKNCHFEDFYSVEGKNYFVVMEGLNKHSGSCTINFENNTFRGDATERMVEVFTKPGYDINIKGNTFIARNKTGLEPFRWNTSYDLIYSDSKENADVSNVDLSGIVEISKNRFIGYTKFSNTVNSLTTFDIADNFFTNDLDTYETCLGGFPTYGAGWKASSYWVDFGFKTYGTTIPELIFTSSEVINGAAAKILYTDKAKINLYDYGMTLPKGVKFTVSGGEGATAISVTNGGVRTIQINVYSYDGTRSSTTSLMIYGRASYADAVAALQEAQIRINSGCYTAASLSAYQTAATLLQNALTSANDPTEYITSLESAEAKLVFVSGAEAEMKYFDYFPSLRKFRIVDANDWGKLAKTVNNNQTLGGYTIRLANDIDFGGATIDPIGGCFSAVDESGNYSFNGTFDGGGHEVSNFVINSASYGVGLFGKLHKATVRNLQIGKGTVTGIDKVAALAGYADYAVISGITNKASVVATDGTNGIAGIVSQARYATALTACINYGSVTATNGRACGVIAWGQTDAKLKYCFNYGTLSAPETYPLAVYNVAYEVDYPALVIDCFYASGSSICGGNLTSVFDQFSLTELNEFAWKSGFNLRNGELVPDGAGTKIYRATLTCTTNEKTYYYYGAANSQIGFDIPGYVIDTVVYNGSSRPLSGLLLTKDCTMTGAAIRVTYNITYHLDGGKSVIDLPATYTADDYVALPSVGQVTKNGYVFYAFYDNASFSGNPIYSIPEDSEGDLHLYAKYVAVDRTITTAAQLVSFANAVNGGTNFSGKAVLIGANINLSGTNYPIIGSSVTTPFQGLLYGGGYTISNLSLSNKPVAGLVGYLGSSGTVAGVIVKGTVSGNVVGGVVANNQGGDVLDCYFNGKASSTATSVKVVSQNVLVNTEVTARMTPLVNSIKKYSPDLIGIQEAGKAWRDKLVNGFSDYGYVWQYRGLESNTTTKGLEATPIFYKKSKFTLISSGTFWLSTTPDKPSLCWDDGMNRICTWAKLKVTATGEILWFFNTHFPLTATAQIGSAGVMTQKMKSMIGKNEMFFVTADWNCTPGSDPYNKMMTVCDDMALYAEVDNTNGAGTGNNGGTSVTPTGGRIDMCFSDYDLVTLPYYSVMVETYTSGGTTLPVSDHFGVYYDFRLDSASGGIVGKNYGEVSNCIAANSGTAAVSGGVINGINRGTVDGCAVFSGTAIGRDEGTSATVTVSNVTNAAHTLNNINESSVWGVNGSDLALRPVGNPIYEISFYAPSGELLKTELTTLAAAVAWKPSLDTASEVFAYWEQDVLSNSATFTAVMKPSTFTVVFLDGEGNVISSQNVEYGKSAVAPAIITPAGKTFAGWSGSYTNVTADAEVKPIFVDAGMFTVTLQTEGDGTALYMNGTAVDAGSTYTAAEGTEVKVKADDTVLYWKDDSGKLLTENELLRLTLTRHVTLTAVYPTDSRVTITFVDVDNTILKTQLLRSGRNAVAPALPKHPGLSFVEWTDSYKAVKEDLVLRAIYTPDTVLTVTAVGGTASASSVTAGTCVTFVADAAPEGKTFAGWSMDGVNVISTMETFTMAINANVTLTALYEKAKYSPIAVTVNEDGTVTLTRRTEGDYTVLGSGLLYGESLNVVMELECVDGTNVSQINDSRLTRNGSMTTELTAAYVRGYLVLLDETTGEVVTFYSAVIKLV